jgi:hypothetical protein
VDRGLRPPPSATPRATARSLTALLDPTDRRASSALSRIVTAQELSAYGPTNGAPATSPGSAQDLLAVRTASLAALPRGVRLRTALLPPAVLDAARGWLDDTWVAVQLGAESVLARLGRRHPHRRS